MLRKSGFADRAHAVWDRSYLYFLWVGFKGMEGEFVLDGHFNALPHHKQAFRFADVHI